MTAWIVRAGREGEHLQYCLENARSVISWPKLTTDLAGKSRDEIKSAVAGVVGDATGGQLDAWAQSLFAFASLIAPGDFVITPYKTERKVAIGRVAGPYEYRPDLGAENQHVRPIEWLDISVSNDLLPNDITRALSGALPTVQRIKVETAEPGLRLLLGLDAGPSPVHVVLRWALDSQHQTIRLHRDVADAEGSVWWGKLGDPRGRKAISDLNLDVLRTQIAAGVQTHLYLYRAGEAWRTTLIDISRDQPAEADLIPDYYGDAPHNLWVRIKDFEALPADWPLQHLVLNADPERSLRDAVGGQASLFLVRESVAERHATTRYFILLQKEAALSDYGDAEGSSYSFGDNVAGRRALLEAQQAQFVYYRPRRGSTDENASTFFGHGRILNVEETSTDGESGFVAHLEDYQPFGRRVPLEEYRPSGWNSQHSIGEVTREVFDEIVRRGGGDVSGAFELADVRAVASSEPFSLDLADDTYAAVISALTSGKHVVLTGPPGTAKTTLAQALAEAARRAGLCDDHLLTTATSDWTTFETIGGLRPQPDGSLAFKDGHFLAALRRGHWLVIDELNRSNFDRAFGQLFTVMSGQTVILPYEDPSSGLPISLVREGERVPDGTSAAIVRNGWRLIATMNVFDKSLLFEMSYALMRRFAFIEVPSPPEEVYLRLIAREAGGNQGAEAVATSLLTLRTVKDLGPALFMDVVRYAAQRNQVGHADRGTVTFEAFYSYLLPQFEGIDDATGKRLYSLVSPLVPDRVKLKEVLVSVLGLEPARLGPIAEAAEGVDLPPPEDDDLMDA